MAVEAPLDWLQSRRREYCPSQPHGFVDKLLITAPWGPVDPDDISLFLTCWLKLLATMRAQQAVAIRFCWKALLYFGRAFFL